MNTEEIINLIASSPKITPQLLLFEALGDVDKGGVQVFGNSIVIDDKPKIDEFLRRNSNLILAKKVITLARNSALPLLNTENINARIEPGAIIREGAEVGDSAVIMMGAVINIGATIGRKTMVDMNAVVGARAIIGERCHIGAGTVVAGMLEPPSAEPVVIGDDVLIGANAVVLESVVVGDRAVIAAGSTVINDVSPGAVVAGSPAKFIKWRDATTDSKTEIVNALRNLPV